MPPNCDPPIRRDGRCAQCHGPRLTRLPKVITQRSKAELLGNLEQDPFCSAPCCRRWHGIDLAEEPAKAPASDLEWTHA